MDNSSMFVDTNIFSDGILTESGVQPKKKQSESVSSLTKYFNLDKSELQPKRRNMLCRMLLTKPFALSVITSIPLMVLRVLKLM